MSGNLAVPNVYATRSGAQAASGLDANWDAVETYVNNREITSGTFSARPSAGVSGRYYFANDLNGGTLYFDNGSSWVQIAAPVNSEGGYKVTGLTGVNKSGSEVTHYDLAANQVILWDPVSGGTAIQTNTGTKTNNTGTAGPAAGGRDQAGAFSASSWVHFYFIWNGTTLSTVSSATAPPTGPTLPSGYTHWAYCGAVRFDGSSELVLTRMRGAWAFYDDAITVLSGGAATSETPVSISAYIPPNALTWQGGMWNTGVRASAGGVTSALHLLCIDSGVVVVRVRSSAVLQASADAYSLSTGFTMPNVGQSFIYVHTVSAGSLPSMNVDVQGYSVPNGDS